MQSKLEYYLLYWSRALWVKID